jgi:hypothetical protein
VFRTKTSIPIDRLVGIGPDVVTVADPLVGGTETDATAAGSAGA